MAEKKKVTAFVYDNATTGSDAPVEFGVIPGAWTPGEAVLPTAFGFTVEQMREAIREHNLPIREARVSPSTPRETLDRGDNHLPTEVVYGTLDKPSGAYRETAAGPIPAPSPGAHPALLPQTAAAQARTTARADGATEEEAEKAAQDAWDAAQARTDAPEGTTEGES